MADVEALVSLFASVGLDDTKARETAKNKKLSANFDATIREAGCERGVSRPTGILLYTLAATCTDADAVRHRPFVARKIVEGAIASEEQIRAAIRYCSRLNAGKAIDEQVFGAECGIGAKVSKAEIQAAVDQVISAHRERLLADRHAYNTGLVLKDAKAVPAMRWADGRVLKDTVDAAIAALLGPATEAGRSGKKTPAASAAASSEHRVFAGEVLKLHRPGENKQLNDEIMRKHLAATGGKVVTRFPPEPNGFPHIGHAKAMNFSFRYAEAHGGICYLRYDDTNPEAEEQRYYDALLEAVRWLGFEPYKITAASDYFQQLYEYAVELIKRGKAYVCHMTPEEIKESRGGESMQGKRWNSPWRDRAIQESLHEFDRMKRGEYEEGKATLRLKQDMQSGNPFMWDLVAYRVMFHPHCRTGTQWCIYPMYDFTHCLCDSIENITHSLCTTEFILAREAYYWVCDSLEVYKAVQWEYGRLNVTHTVTSKRKVAALVKEGHVAEWDDPRLFTLAALRRRGFTPAAINRFVEDLGISTAQATTDVRKLEAFVRDDLNKVTLRRMAVLEPLRVEIVNVAKPEQIVLPNDPRDPAKGDSALTLSSTIYIDRSDFREAGPDAEYYRLAPGQPVGLFRVGVLTFVEAVRDSATGMLASIRATLDRSETAPKPKAFIQWVPEDALPAELRLYSILFNSEEPGDNPAGWLADINPNSVEIVKGALVDPRLADTKPEDKFQFQRLGYFCTDKESAGPGKLVFNLTVTLKEDPKKD